MIGTRPALERVHRIIAELNSRARTSIAQLAEKLESSERTIQRDLIVMRDFLRLPVGADAQGHFFTEPFTSCRCCARRMRGTA